MNWFNRREFLQRSALLSAASATLGMTPVAIEAAEQPAKKPSANERLKVAVVGVRGRGMAHVAGYLNKKLNCEIVTVCDCDEAVTGKAIEAIEKAQGSKPKFEKDFRKLIEDKSIDIISIATPNHWHATMAVWAMKAGKDVYCEKPATHNVHEGRIMTDVARGAKRICQIGTQSRSNPGMRQSIQYIHDGKIGKIKLAYGTCFRSRKSIGKVTAPTEPPKSMDFDLWCGPAAKKPVNRKSLHYDWHWTWEYGNGDFGNQGVHEADKARWGMKEGMPTSVVSFGGRFGYEDDGETPNTQLNLYEFPTAPLIFEVRGLDTKEVHGTKVGNIWFGEKGYVVCPNYSSGIAYDPDGNVVAKFQGGSDQLHFDNFVKAVRSRNESDLNCNVEEGHMSAAICHLGNISYRMGKQTVVADDIRAFENLVDANEALGRMKAHLSDNHVENATAKCLVGVKLSFDPKTEQFSSAAEGDVKKANTMLFREYRKGFEIV